MIVVVLDNVRPATRNRNLRQGRRRAVVDEVTLPNGRRLMSSRYSSRHPPHHDTAAPCGDVVPSRATLRVVFAATRHDIVVTS